VPAQPINPADTEIDDALLVIQQRVSALVDPELIGDDISMRLDRLHADGADPGVLDALADNAADLIDQTNTLADHLRTAIHSARALREQRELARRALEDFKAAVRNVDTDVPEVEEMYEAIQELDMQWMWDATYEIIYDQITANTPLEWNEAVQLIDILTGDGPAPDDILWNELREWLAFVRTETAA